ncbi:hypothetical protein ASD62_17270 [Phycicoccus sp. Root563]|nr:hypothetical protein ASD62_17270 [Phycicoccus sp. Root563]
MPAVAEQAAGPGDAGQVTGSVTGSVAGSVSGSVGSPAAASRAVQVVGWAFVVLAALMVPWTAYLTLHLPSSQAAAHYDLAWGGFDVAMFVALAATAWSALRLHTTLPPLAAVTGTLLVVDAWFDVVTAPAADDRWVAVAMAVLVELPLAGVCLWLAVTGHQLVIRRLRRRARGRPGLRREG